jgi:uncharacterized membrane protein YcaP (DUF421 family)
MAAVVRAFLGYIFLVFVVRIAGRRPGKQMTPFEFVLIFFIGGLALTAMVEDEVSYTCHLPNRNPRLRSLHPCLVPYEVKARGTHSGRNSSDPPRKGGWRPETLHPMRINADDAMASGRDSGLKTIEQVDRAVL